MIKLRVGDKIGGIYLVEKDGKKEYQLHTTTIVKVEQTKTHGWRYFPKNTFHTLYAEDVDINTEDMELGAKEGFILTREVFGLNEITEPQSKRWIKWANENMDKVKAL